MPKPTFLNLQENKRIAIVQAFLLEFTIRSFDEASVSSVVKQLGIAKGSIYQYFENKLDLFQYLISACSVTKQEYVKNIRRSDYQDFWKYYRTIIMANQRFDIENPIYSNFLFRLEDNLKSESTSHLLPVFKSEILQGYEKLVQHEVNAGNFRNDVSVPTLTYLLYKISLSMNEQYMNSYGPVPLKPSGSVEPIMRMDPVAFQRTVDEYLVLLRSAFTKSQK